MPSMKWYFDKWIALDCVAQMSIASGFIAAGLAYGSGHLFVGIVCNLYGFGSIWARDKLHHAELTS